jgi:hypothetical protein
MTAFPFRAHPAGSRSSAPNEADGPGGSCLAAAVLTLRSDP